MSSRTWGMAENSCGTSVTRTDVMAAPGSDDNSTRRSEFPTVVP